MSNTDLAEPEEGLPVLFHHSRDVYEAMLQSSSKQMYIEGGEERQAVIYEGFLTKLFGDELRLSVPYYTTIMRALKRMGCVAQVRRGGSTSPSQWKLFHEPTEELYREKVMKPGRTTTSQYSGRLDQLEGQLHAINRRVNVLENALSEVVGEEHGV